MLLPLLLLAQSVTIPTGDTLTAEIRTADTALFKTFFEECDPAKFAGLMTDDVEFYHDKGGKMFSNAKQFVDSYTQQCEARKAPDAWRSRRELVPNSLHVEALPGWGALEEGDHLFYERQGNGPEHLAGKAHFVQLWQRVGDWWKVSRILSYSHKAAKE